MIQHALETFDVAATLAGCGHETGRGAFLCFEHQTPGDLLLGGQKVVGSAQRKRAGALLQHGSILLAASPHAPHLPGVRERTGVPIDPTALADVLGRGFAAATRWRLEPARWQLLGERIEALAAEKYRQVAWNEKR
jgi:lipoate-protein ligase A